MDNYQSVEKQLFSALQFLHLVIVEKGVAADELHANNQELGAVLNGLLSVRADLRVLIVEDGAQGVPKTNGTLRMDPGLLDFEQLKRQAEEILKRSEAVIQQSTLLRSRSQKVRTALLSNLDGRQDGMPNLGYHRLSKREREVLALIVAGKSSKQIAAELGISFKTAVTHRASIMGKMEVHEIASVVREAIRHGLA